MADKTKQTGPGSVNNILLSEKYPDDRETLAVLREYTRALPGIKMKDAMKNFLLRMMPGATRKLRKSGTLVAGESS